MRALLIAGVAVVAVTAPAFAAALAPNEIQATFFTGQPFTAAATNIKYKMTFSPEGKMTREPIGSGGGLAIGWRSGEPDNAPPASTRMHTTPVPAARVWSSRRP